MAGTATRIDPGAFLSEQVAPRVGRRIEELRSEIARLDRELADRMAVEATIELVLEGEGGGTWYLNVRDGQMTVADQAAAQVIVSVRQTRDDWEELVRAAAGATAMGADLTASRVERLRAIRGTLEFRLTAGDVERRIAVRIGPEGDGPGCTLSMRAEDALRLQTGELKPEAAFIQGLVKIQGDVALAMQVGTTLLSRR